MQDVENGIFHTVKPKARVSRSKKNSYAETLLVPQRTARSGSLPVEPMAGSIRGNPLEAPPAKNVVTAPLTQTSNRFSVLDSAATDQREIIDSASPSTDPHPFVTAIQGRTPVTRSQTAVSLAGRESPAAEIQVEPNTIASAIVNQLLWSAPSSGSP